MSRIAKRPEKTFYLQHVTAQSTPAQRAKCAAVTSEQERPAQQPKGEVCSSHLGARTPGTPAQRARCAAVTSEQERPAQQPKGRGVTRRAQDRRRASPFASRRTARGPWGELFWIHSKKRGVRRPHPYKNNPSSLSPYTARTLRRFTLREGVSMPFSVLKSSLATTRSLGIS